MNLKEVRKSVNEIRFCPICRRPPKIKQSRDASGSWCVIQCKRLFQKPHLKIECGKASPEQAFKYAILAWNEAADEIEEFADKNELDIR